MFAHLGQNIAESDQSLRLEHRDHPQKYIARGDGVTQCGVAHLVGQVDFQPLHDFVQRMAFGAAEKQAAKQGVRADEIKIKGATIKVEGRDGQNRKVELRLDRRTGEVLDRRFDD